MSNYRFIAITPAGITFAPITNSLAKLEFIQSFGSASSPFNKTLSLRILRNEIVLTTPTVTVADGATDPNDTISATRSVRLKTSGPFSQKSEIIADVEELLRVLKSPDNADWYSGFKPSVNAQFETL